MESFQYQTMGNLEQTHWWFEAKRRFIATALPPYNPHWNILDIGAGTGGTSLWLKRYGTVSCVEQSPLARTYLSKKRLHIVSLDIQKARLKKNQYDLVTLFDVLYHKQITHDTSVLAACYKTLKPGGMLIIVDSALPILWSTHDEMMKTRERYILPGLVSKVEYAGFTVSKQSYLYFFLFPVIFLVRCVSKLVAVQSVSAVNPWINRMLLALCTLEAHVLRWVSLPIGSSVFIVARK